MKVKCNEIVDNVLNIPREDVHRSRRSFFRGIADAKVLVCLIDLIHHKYEEVNTKFKQVMSTRIPQVTFMNSQAKNLQSLCSCWDTTMDFVL